MAKLVGGELLDALDALVVEELHVVAGIAIEEIIGAHAEPEEVNLLIGISGLVIDIRDVGRGERTVRTQIRELVEVGEAIHQGLVATTREATNGARVTVILGAIGLLDIGHQVVDEVLAKDITTKAHLGCTCRGCARSTWSISSRTWRQEL